MHLDYGWFIMRMFFVTLFQEEFRRLYGQLEELKERNMRLGNRHLVAKIAAMQEAADNILQAAPVSQINGQSHATLMQQQLHQLSPGNNSGINNGSGGSGGSSPSSAACGSSHSPHTKGKSPSAFGPLTDISEEENPLQSLSGRQVQSPGTGGPKVLETSIDIVIQSDASRKTAGELGDNEQAEENNLNNGFHPLAQDFTGKVEDLSNAASEGITRNKRKKSGTGAVIEDPSGQSTCNSSSDCASADHPPPLQTSVPPDVMTVCSSKERQDNDQKPPEGQGKERKSEQGPSHHHSSVQSDAKAAFFQTPATSSSSRPPALTERQQQQQQNRKKKHGSSPSASPSKKQTGKADKQQSAALSSSTCQKAGGPLSSSTAEGKVVNHKDAAAGSTGTGAGTSGSSQKIILDLDDKSRFTEEITV